MRLIYTKPAYDAAREEIEYVEPSLKDFVNYARPRPRHFLFYSICLEIIAWLALLDVIYADMHLQFYGKSFREFPGILPDLGVFLLILFVALRRVSNRYRLNSKKILLTDIRQPVLYLRAFYEESAPNAIYFDKDRTDETLAKVFKNVGPLIAAGKPNDKQQPLGAVRLYFDDEAWQENIKVLMSMSKLVVIQAGHSPSLDWEISTAMKCLKPHQLLFTFLAWQELDAVSRQSKFVEFATQLKLVSAFDLPKRIDEAYFLYFDREWKPRLASLCKWKAALFSIPRSILGLEIFWQSTFHHFPRFINIHGIFIKASITSVRESLRPVLKIQGIRLPFLRTILNISFTLGLIFYFILLLFIITVSLIT